ncbi:TonB-dependent vitamin B12 receptor [Utexia brackfieldae]|uniref:TonB-dependent vitamin B12 receptor n=1 Tax=Utexia brackfieldae TaxID=3074108 RepID=UPI00370D7889
MKTIFGLAVISSTSSVAIAAETTSHNTLVVTANRFAQPISSVVAPINVITRAEIDRWQTQSVPEILRRLPGVTVSQAGGRGQVASVFIRGNESKHVLILIDGIRIPSSATIMGNTDLSQIPVALIQRIEYIRGPHAATYGSDAIGGVINIITESDSPVSKINATYGSQAYQNYNAAIRQDITDKTTLSLAGGYESTTGYNVMPQSNEPDKDGFREKSLWLGLKHQFSNEVTGFIRGYGNSNNVEYDGYYNESNIYTHNYDTGLQYQNENYSSQLVTSFRQYKIFNFNHIQGKNSTAPNDVTQQSIQWGNTYRLAQGAIISGGVDFYANKIGAGSGGILTSHSKNNTGIYLTGQKQLNTVLLETAVRLDDDQQYGRHATWQVASEWEFIDNHRISLSYGTAFKAPTFGEIYDGAWGVIGNPDLRPETSRQWELGVSADYDLFAWRTSAYYNKVQDLIQWKSLSDWTSTYENIDNANIKGIEFNLNFDTGPVHHNATFEYIDARKANGELLLKRPHKNFQYQLDATINEIEFSLAYLYKGQSRDYGKVQPIDSYSVWDISASYRIVKNIIVSGKIANLFDKKYETAIGYPAPEREYSMTLSYEF